MRPVALVKYDKPLESLRKAVELCDGFSRLSPSDQVFIKPNLVIWLEGVNFPKFGVLTTARMIEDMVVLLKEQGVGHITLAEGGVAYEKGGESLLSQAVRGMNLDKLARKYGVKFLDVHQRPFQKVEAGGLKFSINQDILLADFVIDLPVLKTHTQSRLSLGIKNLKGLLNIASRKRCHNADPEQGLDHYLARLPELVWPSLTVIDGIFSLERGPLYTGQAHRTDVIVASPDVIAADQVAATLLGFSPAQVPHLAIAAARHSRPNDLSDIELQGGIDLRGAIKPHAWEFPQDHAAGMPVFMAKAGIQGINYPEADNSLCTYCSHFINFIIMGILSAENRSQPFDEIEILYGKKQKPSGRAKHTLLAGQCQVKANADSPLIKHCVPIKGCPPSLADFMAAYQELGIVLPEGFAQWMGKSPETLHMRRYLKDAAYDQGLFKLTE